VFRGPSDDRGSASSAYSAAAVVILRVGNTAGRAGESARQALS